MAIFPGGRASNTEPSPPVPERRTRRMALLALTLALSLLGIWVLRGLLVPLAWATILAFASWPLYQRFVRALSDLGYIRKIAPIAFTLLVGLIFLAPLALVALEFARDAPNVAHWAASVEKKGLSPPDWISRVPIAGHYVFDWWKANLSDPGAATELLGRLDRSVLVYWISSLGAQLLYRLTDLLFTLLTLYFLYRHGASLARQLHSFVDVMLGEAGERLIGGMLAAVRGAVNGLVLVGLGEGLVLGISYTACGLPHPVAWGVVTGVVAAIPFGVFVMFGAGTAVLFAQSSPGAAIALFGIGITVLIIADYFVRPLVIGNAAKLPFLWVLFGILGGVESFGLLGLFLGPALLACLLSLWRELAGRQATRSP